jgi:hypothetical protein
VPDGRVLVAISMTPAAAPDARMDGQRLRESQNP